MQLSTPQIMGVLNMTPDSFSDGGSWFSDGHPSTELALTQALQMHKDGASIIDVGGESTRPGAAPVTVQEELDRVIPVIEALRGELPITISVDTSTPDVMSAAAAAGVDLLNDVRAFQRPGALEVAAASGLPVCLMHMQGEPDTMQKAPHYVDVVDEVCEFILQRVQACEAAGISRENVIVDPGFGFGKTLDHNLRLLAQLNRICDLGYPVLAGLSRKSMIAKVLDDEKADRTAASVALAMQAVERGAVIVRVHDVLETWQALQMLAAIKNAES